MLAACYLTISQEKQKTYKNNLKTNLNGSTISSNMHNLLCWTKCWIRLNAPISPNISQKNKKIMLHDLGGKLFQNNFFMQHFLSSKTKNTCQICLKWSSNQPLLVYYPTFKFLHHFECLFLCFRTFERLFKCFY